MITYFILTSVVMFIELAVFIWKDSEHKISAQGRMITLIMCLANLGYLALAISDDLGEAILANKITYLGGCFMPPIMLFLMCNLCNFDVPKWLKRVLYSYSSFVYLLILSTGFSNFYYKEVTLETYHGVSRLANVHGPGYLFFNVIIYGYITVDIILCGYVFFRKKASRRNITILFIIQAVTMITFVVGRAVDPHIEVMPVIYIFDGIALNILDMQLVRYTLKDNIITTIEQNNTSGFVTFDTERRYLSASTIAKNIIPELRNCRIDRILENERAIEFFYGGLDEYRMTGKTNKGIWKDDIYYQMRINDIIQEVKNKPTKIGFLVELKDNTDRKKYENLMTDYSNELKRQVYQQTEHISEIQKKIILGMADMVENRDDNTGGHIKRTSEVVKILVDTIRENKLFNLSDEFCENLIKAAPMHDLGKIAIDDKILRKPGKYTPEEFEIMKSHATKSAEICEGILRGVEDEQFVNIAVNVARYHHEKWNGEGYPEGLKGKAIPIEARIMALADVYDALVSKRCYKEPMSFDEANKIMMESMGSHFDPAMKPVFEKSRSKLEDYFRQGIGQ